MKSWKFVLIILCFGFFQINCQVSAEVENGDKTAVIVNVSNPAMPGKLSVIVGDGWDVNAPVLKLMKVGNSAVKNPSGLSEFKLVEKELKALRIVRNEPQVLTCDFPNDPFSVYAVVAMGNNGFSKPLFVNAARTEWLSKAVATGGDTVRIFGRNLVNLDLYPAARVFEQAAGYGSYLLAPETKISIEAADGTFHSCKVVKASAYDVHFIVPSEVGDGSCKIYAHNGLGGKYGWSDPVGLVIRVQKAWPTKVFNVKDFGATGYAVDNEAGWNDDAPAIQKALDAAGANGGGIVYFSAGSYYVTKTLSIPKYTVLQGESRERSWIFFPNGQGHGKSQDFAAASKVTVGLRGMSDFSLENLSIHSVYTNMLIAAPFAKDNASEYTEIDITQRADNITIDNCNIVHEPFMDYHTRRGDPLLEKSTQFDESWGMKATVALHGDNIKIVNSRIRGGGMAVVLISCRFVRIAGNELIIGRSANAIASREFGYPKLPRPQKIIIEDNNIWPATPVSHSGIWTHATSQDMYLARNTVQLTWGCDSEGLLWHGWGPEQAYETQTATGNTITLKDVEKVDALGWLCVISKGKGIGQKRIVKEIKGNTLVLDKPWDLIPGEGSKLALVYYNVHENITIVQNKLSDTGAGIFCWGEAWGWIVDGNSMTRGGGVMFDQCAYTPDRAWSGNFFNQILNNHLDQGRFLSNYVGGVWTLGYTGTGYCREFNKGQIGNLSHIYRNNLSTNDAALSFWDRVCDNTRLNYTGPLVDVGLVVEDNWFKNCRIGISAGDGVSGVIRGNQFQNVDTHVRLSKGAGMLEDGKAK
jgi:hypothetical protein